MPQFDLPLAELETYRPFLAKPPDLDAFWANTLLEARALRRPIRMEHVETGLRLVDSWDIEFSGFGGHPIRAWLHLPKIERPAAGFSVVVEYVGAGAGRGLPHEASLWALAGHAHFIMDNRGQGSGWRAGHTADPVDDLGGAPSHPGFTTRGIMNEDSYYYRRLFTDAVLAVDLVRDLRIIDASQVYVDGISQGGGVAIAVASLSPGLRGLMTEVPFMANIRRGVAIAGTAPYSEVSAYLAVHRDRVDRVFETLSYFDVAVLADRGTAPSLFAAALMDVTTPPSTVFAAYNNYGGPKQMIVYPYNGHEGGGSHFSHRKIIFVDEPPTSDGSVTGR